MQRTALGFVLASSLCAQGNQDPNKMDFGPFLSATVTAPWPKDAKGNANTALKGIAIHVGSDAAVLFDTELLRVAGAWTGGFVNLLGTPYDGSHGPHPTVKGTLLVGTRNAPGIAKGGSFADPRPIPNGPLPRDHAAYRGLYLDGNRVVLSYTAGTTGILETHDLEKVGGLPVLTRSLDLGAGDAVHMVLGEREGTTAELGSAREALLFRTPPAAGLVTTVRSGEEWDALDMSGPSATDYADVGSGHGVVFRAVVRQGGPFAVPHGNAGAQGLALPRLNDGLAQDNHDDLDRSVFFEGDRGRIHCDLQKAIAIGRVSTFSWHRAERAAQRYTLWGSAADTVPTTDGDDPAKDGWTRIADVDTSGLGAGGKHAVRIQQSGGAALGTFRHLLFDVRRARGGTFFGEIDVVEQGAEAPLPAVEAGRSVTGFALVGAPEGCKLIAQGDRIELVVPARQATTRFKIAHWDGAERDLARFRRVVAGNRIKAPGDLTAHTHGGKKRFPGALATTGSRAKDTQAYVVDTITIPMENPWGSWMRTAAMDFFSDGRAAVSTWNGDVWIVAGIDDSLEHLTWKRFATGLFDPLGLKIVDDKVYTLGRDQITRLHDLNGDGEADFYECFNNQVLITQGFHEFAFDLQTDPSGDFYFSKAGPVRPGGRGFEPLVPHHGTLLKVKKDGSSIEVVATGLRAPNGIGVGPHGEMTSGDNQGTWMPRCRLNWITPGAFLGCTDTAHRKEKPTTYDQPICWFPMEVDNSGGGQVWITSDRFGPLKDELMHLSYGTCTLYRVMKEFVDGQIQGGVVAVPCSFGSSLMRARMNPKDGQLYVIGFKGWQTSANWDGGFQRVRYTGKKCYLPRELHVTATGVTITFEDELDPKTANDAGSFDVSQWNYVWDERYGSPEVSLKKPLPDIKAMKDGYHDFKDHDTVVVKSAKLRADKRTVELTLDAVVPVMQMRIAYNLDAADGAQVKGEIYNSIHKVPAAK